MKVYDVQAEIEHMAFLANHSGRGLLAREVAKSSLALLQDLRSLVSDLPMPDAAVGEDGVLLLIWDQHPHYLSIEIGAEGFEPFYFNRESRWVWGPEDAISFDGVRSAPMAILVEELGRVSTAFQYKEAA